MFDKIKSMFGTSAKNAAISAANKAILSTNQPKLAPVAFGGSVIAGIVAILLGTYKVVDCVRYQQRPGQCDTAIEINLPGIVTGFATILGSWGAFNTFNPALRTEPAPERPASSGYALKPEDEPASIHDEEN